VSHTIDAAVAKWLAQEVRAQQARQSVSGPCSRGDVDRLITLPSKARTAVLRAAFPTTTAGREWTLSSWCSALRSSPSSPVLLTSLFVEH